MAKMKYKMSSRATILLGRESVSRVDGAIIELVKNTYDADAGFCCLCFDVEHDQIYILDNGVGMTKETIETCWMLIGTDNKRVEYLSTKKRIKSGEKGIGRFALDRLGSKCRMYTKHDSEDLICWETDWSNFEKSGQIIDDVEADFTYCAGQRFEDIIPAEIKNAVAKFAEEAKDDQFVLNRGTLFIISGLRDKWTTREKEKVIDVLGYLIPPVEQQNYAIITQDSLDARKGVNPVAISDKSGQWHVNNSQLQGTVLISRVFNASILDKSNREGIIENEYFETLSSLLISIISIFEKDRAYIVRNIKQYNDNQNQREKAKEEATDIAKTLLGKKNRRPKEQQQRTASDAEKLAEAVQIFQEEREELISEIKLLRALATNGLMTTTMVHDLKSINALLVSRVRGFRLAIKQNDTPQIQRNLDDLKTNDEFLKSWITVITTQTKKDRRKRLKKDIYKTVAESLKLIKPILDRKMVRVNFSTDGGEAYKKIFATDFDSIIYNLIINSIESFEETKVAERLIEIAVESGDILTVHYSDNGHGLTEAFKKNPYSIFEYGTTSKFDAEGKAVGTGLGMYIVASSINEYNGRYTITRVENGFGLDITIPLSEEGL